MLPHHEILENIVPEGFDVLRIVVREMHFQIDSHPMVVEERRMVSVVVLLLVRHLS